MEMIVGAIGVMLICLSFILIYVSYFLLRVSRLLVRGYELVEVHIGKSVVYGWVQRNSIMNLSSLRGRGIDGFIELRNKSVLRIRIGEIVKVVSLEDRLSYIRHGRHFKSNI